MVIFAVAPFAGAWIEIFALVKAVHVRAGVAPFAGAWIEISDLPHKVRTPDVAPFAGAWIEILLLAALRGAQIASLPSRERGLK